MVIRCGAMPGVELSAPISELILGKRAEIRDICVRIEGLQRGSDDGDVGDQVASLEEMRAVIEHCVDFLVAIDALQKDGYSGARFHAAVRCSIAHFAAQRRAMAGAFARDGTYLYGEEDAYECEVMNELLSEFLQ